MLKTLQLLLFCVIIQLEVLDMPDFLYSFNEDVMSNPSNEHFRLHSHSEYEIYMFLSGDSKYVVEGKNYELSHGDIIIIRKHEMHRVFHNSNKEYHRLVIMISPDFFKKYHCEEYKDEAYLFVPYDEEYYQGLSKYIDKAWEKFNEK